jgi:hypothetical protein
MKVSIPISQFGVGILTRPDLLVALRCLVYVEIVEGIALDMVRVLVALAVVASQTE